MKSVVVALLTASAAFSQTASLRGYPAAAAQAEHDWERKLQQVPEAARIKVYSEQMARVPHAAGSAESRAVAEYALGLFRSWGLDAHIETFEALLPYPTVRVLEMESPVRFVAQLREPPIAGDRNSSDAHQLPTFNAYSATADITAPLVYVNYGLPEDYDELARRGIDVNGKIVIARYGKSWRGVKPKLAQEHGAAGCLIYSDPHEDGYFVGDVYPQGPFRPPQGVQRGSVVDMAVYPGDPLTPGWASEKGAKRLSRDEARTIMKIPVLPLSYGDAQPLLAQLGGAVVPEDWRGALPITYHFGPGTSPVHLKTDFDWSTKPVYDVIATIPGSDFPNEWIIYGNHHDAWVNGANDPVSGAAALLETGRSLAELRRQGWRPRRTIKLALWDAEEFGLVGSTEWAEKHSAELSEKAVAYFNSDSNGRGSLGASGSPVLESMLTGVLSELRDPGTGVSLLRSTGRRRANHRAEGTENPGFHLGALGAGSDYVVFAHHLGISSLNLGFGSADSGGVYHSVYDSLFWYDQFSDGARVYGRALAQVYGTCLMRMADAPVLPLEFVTLARTVRGYVNELRREAEKQGHHLQLSPLTSELDRLQSAAGAYELVLPDLLARLSAAPAARLESLNRALFLSERALLSPDGLPGREWYKSQLAAPGLYTGYGAKTLPAIREAVEAGRYAEANDQVKTVVDSLRAMTDRISRCTQLARELAGQ